MVIRLGLLSFRYLPVLFWAGQIFFISSSSDPIDLLPTFAEKVPWRTIFGTNLMVFVEMIGHLINFGVLAFLIARALIWKSFPKQNILFIAFSIACLFGLTDEIHQRFVPDRSFQTFDLFMDAIGSAFGVLLYYRLSKHRSTQSIPNLNTQ